MMRALWPLLVGISVGCFRSYEPSPAGGAEDASEDAAVSADSGGAAIRDASTAARDSERGVGDAVEDAAKDAPGDGGTSTTDAEPPPPRPPRPEGCRIEPTIFPFDDPVLEYRWPNGPVVHRDSVHVSATPLVIDLEPSSDDPEDLEPVLVFTSYPPLGRRENPGVLRIVDPRTDTTTSYPPTEGRSGVLEATTNLAAGDLDGDGRNEIVGFGARSATYAFRSDGSLLWTSGYPRFDDRGTLRSSSIGGGPALADLDGDGNVEVIVGRAVLAGATGALLWDADDRYGTGTNNFLGPLPCVSDLEGDGLQEVIAGNTVFEHDGRVRWQADVPDGLCAVGDILPEVEGPEIVHVANGFVRLFAPRDGEVLYLRRLEGRASRSVGGAPTVADFDGDGRAEMGIAHGGAYGVYDPGCTGSDGGCTARGLLWKASTEDGSSAGTGSSVFDFNGDGRAEVVYNDERYFRVFDGIDGSVLFQHRNTSRTRTENPSIADIDNDGDAEIVFSANAEARFLREFWTDPGVEIWGDARGRWVGARRIWNQHAYATSGVEENGAIPRRPATSWSTHNTFRQNRKEGTEADVLNVPDLWGGRGSYECIGTDRARLTFQVGNYGLERAGAGVVAAVYRGRPEAGERVAEVLTTRPLRPRGDSETLEIDVSLEDPVVDYWVVLDAPEVPAAGAIFECREENNEVLVWRPSCP